jgi:hypothetical protein
MNHTAPPTIARTFITPLDAIDERLIDLDGRHPRGVAPKSVTLTVFPPPSVYIVDVSGIGPKTATVRHCHRSTWMHERCGGRNNLKIW